MIDGRKKWIICDCVENILDREIDLEVITLCVRKLKDKKTGGSDGLWGSF